MILTSTTATVPFTPAWRVGKADAPVFHIRAGSVLERAQYEAELSGVYRAGRVYGFELREAIRTGVCAILADDPALDHILGVVAAEAEAENGGDAEPLSQEDALLFAEIRNILAQHWPPYRDLVAQLERRRELAPVLAFRRFCTGWENAGVEYARDWQGQVDSAAMLALSSVDITAAGNQAFNLLYPDPSAEGNSSPAASSESGQTTSPSDDTSKAAGKLPASGGKKTPASRSQRGSRPSSKSTS